MRPYIRASAFRLVDFFDRYFRGLGSPLPQRPSSVLVHITNLRRPTNIVDIGAKFISCSLHTSQEPRPQELLGALKAL